MIALDALRAGDKLPPLQLPPVSRLTLALYAGASGDHNPLHIDLDAAHEAGMPDVFAQGMLPMAWLARLLTDYVPQRSLRSYGVRFAAITQLREALVCSARVGETYQEAGERRARLELSVTNGDGLVKLSGQAVIALPAAADSHGFQPKEDRT